VQLIHIKRAETAKEAWEALKKYHTKSTLSSKIRLTKKLFKAELPKGGSMESHLQQMFEWMEELREVDAELKDTFIVTTLLASLNEDYDTLITALEARKEDDLKIEFVRSKLLEEWDKLKLRDQKKESAMKTVHSTHSSKAYSSDHTKKTCFFCK
jgi:hypothetical protein